MKLHNLLVKGLLCLSLGVFFASCEDDNKEVWKLPTTTNGVYVLNSGIWKENNSTLTYYDPITKKVTANVFDKTNKKGLGDTAQDLLVYGSKMYISVTTSNVIYVTKRDGTIISEIHPTQNGAPENPRSLASHNGKVYVSMQSGYVAQIDTASNEIDARVKVGSYPEQIAVSNNKLYVTNSGQGSGSTLSVINLSNFTATPATIDVRLNPTLILADGKGNVYVVSNGDRQAIKEMVQKVDANGVVTEIGQGTQMALSGDKLYIAYSGFDASWNATATVFSWYNTTTGELKKERFVAEKDGNGNALDLSKTVAISVDPSTKAIYIATSDYVTNGDMYVFSATGAFADKFDTQGISPAGAYFLTNK